MAVGLTLVEVLTAIAAAPAARDLQDALRSEEPVEVALTWYDGLTLLFVPVVIVTYVVACLWLQYARSNTDVIVPVRPHQRRMPWVWLGWWVPVVLFWFPLQVVRDVRDGSRPTGAPIGLGLWWTAWVVWLVANRAGNRLLGSDDPDVVGLMPTVAAVGAAALVVACIQWCRIVHRITADQRAALARPAS
jgi:hypothetical protein